MFLAEQLELADRQVALKVSRSVGDEPQLLARLRHTHIVPIHSVHDDPISGLRLLVHALPGRGEPGAGARNVRRVPRDAGHRPQPGGGGIDLIGQKVSAVASEAAAGRRMGSLRKSQDWPRHPVTTRRPRGVGSPSTVRSIFGKYWARLPLVEPADRQNAVRPRTRHRAAAASPPLPAQRQLTFRPLPGSSPGSAEGLEHAHSRGLLHRDLKPSNILIAADGTPMLLDFNLSADAPGFNLSKAPRQCSAARFPTWRPST